jgi:hypothetical protein
MYWERFCDEWKNILKRYDVRKFHFREYNAPTPFQKPGNPYVGWQKESRDKFLHELAALAGSVAVPIGGTVPALEDMRDGKIDDPFKAATWACFQDLSGSITTHWPNLKGQNAKECVHVVYGDTQSKVWRNSIQDVFIEAKGNDPKFGHITPGNDDSDIPLQAADLYAAMGRQQRGVNGDNPRFIDFLLNKNIFPPSDPRNFQRVLSNLLPLPWDTVMKNFSEHRKEFEKTNPGERYYPLTHYPFKRHYK